MIPETIAVKDKYIQFVGHVNQESGKALREACENAARENAARIFLLIESLGGDSNEGLDIAYYLQEFNTPVTTYVDNFAESSAAFIFLGGHERIAHPKSHLYFHPQVHTLKIENWTELNFERYLGIIKSERRKMIQLLASNSTYQPRTLRSMFRERGHLVDAMQAKNVGLVHKIERLRVPTGTNLQVINIKKPEEKK